VRAKKTPLPIGIGLGFDALVPIRFRIAFIQTFQLLSVGFNLRVIYCVA